MRRSTYGPRPTPSSSTARPTRSRLLATTLATLPGGLPYNVRGRSRIVYRGAPKALRKRQEDRQRGVRDAAIIINRSRGHGARRVSGRGGRSATGSPLPAPQVGSAVLESMVSGSPDTRGWFPFHHTCTERKLMN